MTRYPLALASLLITAACAHPGLHAPGEGSGAKEQPHRHAHRGPAQHRFEDAARWAKVFDDPERDGWQQPDRVIEALRLAPTDKVADLGAGTGYFAVRLARAVPQGKVYGVDVEPEMVRYLAERAAREGLPNVVAVEGGVHDARLPEPVDLVLIVDTYHHLSDRPAYLRRLLEDLSAQGRIAIVDFRMGAAVGPPDAHKVPLATLEEELRRAGMKLLERHDFLPHQDFLVFGR